MKDVRPVDAARTPSGKDDGALAGARPDDPAAHALRALLTRTPGPDPARIDGVRPGNADGAGEENRNAVRVAAPPAGALRPEL